MSYQRRTKACDHVAIIVRWTAPYPTGTRHHISKTLRNICTVNEFSQKLTSSALTTKSRSRSKTLRKPRSRDLWGFSKQPKWCLDFETPFKRAKEEFVYAYIDDFLITSETEEQHREHLRIMLERLNAYGIIINPANCEFGMSEIIFLGYTVNEKGIKQLAERVDAIFDVPLPVTVKALCRYLRMINFYRRYIPGAAKISQPLNDLLNGVKKGNAPIEWSKQSETSFCESKRALANATMLAQPISGAPVSLAVDQTHFRVGPNPFLASTWKRQPLLRPSLNIPFWRNFENYDRSRTPIRIALIRGIMPV